MSRFMNLYDKLDEVITNKGSRLVKYGHYLNPNANVWLIALGMRDAWLLQFGRYVSRASIVDHSFFLSSKKSTIRALGDKYSSRVDNIGAPGELYNSPIARHQMLLGYETSEEDSSSFGEPIDLDDVSSFD